jgi:hypothetical protein
VVIPQSSIRRIDWRVCHTVASTSYATEFATAIISFIFPYFTPFDEKNQSKPEGWTNKNTENTDHWLVQIAEPDIAAIDKIRVINRFCRIMKESMKIRLML